MGRPTGLSKWRLASRAVPAALIVLALAVLAWRLRVEDLLLAFRTWSEQAGPLGALVYALLYVAASLLWIPVFALSLGAGFLFGFAGGVAVSLLAIAAAAATAFAVGRSIGRRRVERMVASHPRFSAVDGGLGENGWKVVALLRMIPVLPFSPSNYLYGATSIRFGPYILGTVLGMIPDTVVYAGLGSAGHFLLDEGAPRRAGEWLLLAMGVAATLVATVLITRAAKRALDRQRGVPPGVAD